MPLAAGRGARRTTEPSCGTITVEHAGPSVAAGPIGRSTADSPACRAVEVPLALAVIRLLVVSCGDHAPGTARQRRMSRAGGDEPPGGMITVEHAGPSVAARPIGRSTADSPACRAVEVPLALAVTRPSACRAVIMPRVRLPAPGVAGRGDEPPGVMITVQHAVASAGRRPIGRSTAEWPACRAVEVPLAPAVIRPSACRTVVMPRVRRAGAGVAGRPGRAARRHDHRGTRRPFRRPPGRSAGRPPTRRRVVRSRCHSRWR